MKVDSEINSLHYNPTIEQIKSHKENKIYEVHNKSNIVCCCFKNYFKKNYIFPISKRYLELSSQRICSGGWN